MNKTISILAGLFLLLLTFGVISNVVGREIAEQPAAADDDGPSLSGSLQTQQNEPNEQAKNNNGNESDSAIASADAQTGSGVPQTAPAKDSPDDPVKNNVEGPVEERTDVKPAEGQIQSKTETKPATPVEIPSGDKPAADTSSQPGQSPAVVPPKPKRELAPALAALREKTRRTLATYQQMPFNSRQNTPDEIIDYCLALGCDAEITLLAAEGERRANGIMCLCWNYPCAGYRPLTMIDGHVSARLGFGLQSRPSQLLAALALARVPASYPMRVGNSMCSVADLVESEKLSCRSGTDMSLKLIGLAYYADAPAWKNDLDEEWSLEKIIKEELAAAYACPRRRWIRLPIGLKLRSISSRKTQLARRRAVRPGEKIHKRVPKLRFRNTEFRRQLGILFKRQGSQSRRRSRAAVFRLRPPVAGPFIAGGPAGRSGHGGGNDVSDQCPQQPALSQ